MVDQAGQRPGAGAGLVLDADGLHTPRVAAYFAPFGSKGRAAAASVRPANSVARTGRLPGRARGGQGGRQPQPAVHARQPGPVGPASTTCVCSSLSALLALRRCRVPERPRRRPARLVDPRQRDADRGHDPPVERQPGRAARPRHVPACSRLRSAPVRPLRSRRVGGDARSLGYLDGDDVRAAVAFARERGRGAVALLGYSLGAALAVQEAARDPQVGAVIDSMQLWMVALEMGRPERERVPSRCSAPRSPGAGWSANGAGDGNRTRINSLEGCRTAIVLHPPGGATQILAAAVDDLPGPRRTLQARTGARPARVRAGWPRILLHTGQKRSESSPKGSTPGLTIVHWRRCSHQHRSLLKLTFRSPLPGLPSHDRHAF